MMSNKFVVDGVKVVCEWMLVFKGYIITWFGTIRTRKSRSVMERYFKTYLGKKTINHEKIHIDQEKQLPLGWITYYIVYLWYWFKLFIVTFNNDLAYRTIPFEIEAYENDSNFNYLDSPTNYKKYIMSNKDRKAYYKAKYKK